MFSPDSKLIVTASWDNTSRLWDISKGEQIFALSGHSDIVNRAFFSPDGERIITVSEDNTASILDVATGKEIHILKGHKVGLVGAVFSPDGKWIVFLLITFVRNGNDSGFWSLDSGKLRNIFYLYLSSIQHLATSIAKLRQKSSL